jgi:hypothetical protein
MDYVLIYFILTGGFGVAPTLEIHKTDMSCGLNGAVIGVQIDKLVNPTKVYWPDPNISNMHCIVDISKKVVTLEPGEYHIATSIMGSGCCEPTVHSTPYIGHDPHTTGYFTIIKNVLNFPSKPSQLKLKGQ